MSKGRRSGDSRGHVRIGAGSDGGRFRVALGAIVGHSKVSSTSAAMPGAGPGCTGRDRP